ncbi:MAG: MopE-related protein, partial [Myxococcota bacterium]
MRLAMLLGLLMAVGCAVDSDGDGFNSDDDCDDENEQINENADEVCDGVDNDCDGQIDEGQTTTYYRDVDGDGYGTEAVTLDACETPDGYAAQLGDCEDDDASIFPTATELCDYIDNDCDDNVDEDNGLTTDFYFDNDGDGVGSDSAAAVQGCLEQPPVDASGNGFYVTSNTDCDDENAAISPNATEVCDGIDNDCNGTIDGAEAIDSQTFYYDDDSDGYGVDDETTNVVACTSDDNFVDNADDCDDTSALVNPAATEFCDDVDNDCDEDVDEDDAEDATTWYGDADGDGFGGAGTLFTQVGCSQPSGYVDNTEDCNDIDPAVNPNATEICDEIDNNCDNATDDGDIDVEYIDADGEAVLWYIDVDGDGFGTSRFTLQQCSQPGDYVAADDENLDCDDGRSEINPAADEICDDGVDNNCDEEATPCSLEGTYEATEEADYRIYGTTGADANAGDQLGYAIAVGDFNGDDQDDLLIGA